MEKPSSGLGPQLLSAGLFLATALASQLLQHYMKTQDETLKEEDRGHHQRVRQQLLQQRQRHHYAHRHAWQDEDDEFEANGDNINRSCGEGYREDDDSDEITNNESNQDLLAFREYYRLRRMGGRLSYENLRPLVHEAEMSVSPLNKSLLKSADAVTSQENMAARNSSPKHANATATAHHHVRLQGVLERQPPQSPSPLPTPPQHNSPRQHKPHIRHRKRSVSIIDREDEYDFLPKNSNWNHFERYNEEDIRDGIVSPNATESTYHHQNHFPQGCGANGYGYDKYYGRNSAPKNYESEQESDTSDEKGDSSSESSEEQFVWTEAVHEKRGNQRRPSRLESEQSTAAHTQECSIEAELPGRRPSQVASIDGGSPGAPLRKDDVESNLQKEPPVPLESGDYPPANHLQQRQFLRHASSTNSSGKDEEWLPQRFPPASSSNHSTPKQPRRLRKRMASGDSAVMGDNEDVSGLSSSSHHRTSRNKDPTNSSHRSARAQYNAKIMPNKVVMVRHGQSMGNINEELYSTTPDNAMPLTKLGWQQARKAGQHLKNNVLAPMETVHFIVSPYVRTVETFHGIVSAWCDPNSPEFASIPDREMRLKAWYGRLLEMGLTWHEDPRIREQDFGNYQDPETIKKAKRDRHNFGIFYYRFPHGESASDVFDRVSTFLDSLWRSFDMNRSRNYVLVTHGISIRVLLARYFRYTIHQFNMLANPRNCEMVTLGHDGHGRLRLEGRYQLHLKEIIDHSDSTEQHPSEEVMEEEKDKSRKKEKTNCGKATTTTEVDEYRFYKRLRILPQAAIRKVHIRISYDDAAK